MQGVRAGGRRGVHTEHLGHLLAEMQFLPRAYRTRNGGARAGAAGTRAMVTPEQRAPRPRAPATPPSLAAIWSALDGVPDPEIPAVSVVELGIIRGVEWERRRPTARALVVRVTPTYSGCPATELIMLDPRGARGARGDAAAARHAARARVDHRLDRAGGEAEARCLRDRAADGDAPAGGRVDVTGISPLRRAVVAVACPRCGATATRLVSQFGSTACKAHYRCVACLEPFDYFKPH